MPRKSNKNFDYGHNKVKRAAVKRAIRVAAWREAQTKARNTL